MNEVTAIAATASPVREVYSVQDSERLLHVIVDTTAVTGGRLDVSPTEEPLQLSVIPLQAGRGVKPHQHFARNITEASRMAQEAWIVVRGVIEVRLYDIDRSFLQSTTLQQGSILVTFRGGHAFQAVADDTVIIECKPGPYVGKDYETFG